MESAQDRAGHRSPEHADNSPPNEVNIPAEPADVPEDVSDHLQGSIARLERRLRFAAMNLARSVNTNLEATRSTASSESRSHRSEMQALKDNLTALREAMAMFEPPAGTRTHHQTSETQQTTANTPNTNRPTPLPANLPRFHRVGASTQSVEEFLTAFEDRLRAHGYPESRYMDALLTCCDKNEADWCRKELKRHE